MSLIKNFYAYQKIRFPIIVIGLSLLPAVLSTTAVVNVNPKTYEVFLGFLVGLLYLLHIRIIDEKRDLDHDNIHHKERPIQSGIISLPDLKLLDNFIIVLILFISFFAGVYAFIISLVMLGYSYLAANDFFIKQKIRKHFFLYNAINTFQTLLMQLYLYAFFATQVPLTSLVLLHFIFTSLGTIVFEFTRKIKIPGTDGTGKDTYTFFLGFQNSIFIYLCLTALNLLIFHQIINIIQPFHHFWLYFTGVFYLLIFSTAIFHLQIKSLKSEQLMQLTFILIYLMFNLFIYNQSL